MKYFARIAEREYEIDILDDELLVDGEPITVDLIQTGEAELYSLLYDGHSYEILIEAERFNYSVILRGEQVNVQVEDERTRKLNAGRRAPAVPDGEFAVRAPIPGLVVKVLVEAGQEVEEAEALLILEAMKMENEIRSPRAGTVKSIEAGGGQRVEQNAPLIILD